MNAEQIEALEIARACLLNLARDVESGRPFSKEAPANLRSLSQRLTQVFPDAFLRTCSECQWTGPREAVSATTGFYGSCGSAA